LNVKQSVDFNGIMLKTTAVPTVATKLY